MNLFILAIVMAACFGVSSIMMFAAPLFSSEHDLMWAVQLFNYSSTARAIGQAFIILGFFALILFAIWLISFLANIKNKETYFKSKKYLVFTLLTSILAIGPIIITFLFIGRVDGLYVRPSFLLYIYLILMVAGIVLGIISSIIKSTNVKYKSEKVVVEKAVMPKATKQYNVEVLASIDPSVKLTAQTPITAVSNTGIGLWTSICNALCAIFGKKSKAYNKKLEKIKNDAINQLLNQAEYLNADAIVNITFALSNLTVIASATAIKYK